MQQQDVEQLVEQVAQRLGRGLSLEDLDGLLLAYSSNQSHADRVRVNFLLSKRVPVDVIAWQLSHGIATAVRPVVVPANEDLGMLGRVCVPLLVRGFRVGYLWVQLDAEEPSAATVLAQLPDVARSWSSCPPCCWIPIRPSPSSAAAANRSSWPPAPARPTRRRPWPAGKRSRARGPGSW